MLERAYLCPYCGESQMALIDPSVSYQEYTEDCSVCCRPIAVKYSLAGQDVDLSVAPE